MAADILIVDDEADIRDLVAGILEDEGHNARLARDSDEALRAIEERRPHLVVLDIWLQGSRLDGLEVLSYIKRSYPDLPVVIISGHGNIETAVTAIKRGAYDYIEKPFKADRLILVTLRALEAFQLKREVKELRERSSISAEMIGKSSAINQLRNAIDRVAPTNSRILIRGPSGSGKELAARVIHLKSARADAPFVVLKRVCVAMACLMTLKPWVLSSRDAPGRRAISFRLISWRISGLATATDTRKRWKSPCRAPAEDGAGSSVISGAQAASSKTSSAAKGRRASIAPP